MTILCNNMTAGELAAAMCGEFRFEAESCININTTHANRRHLLAKLAKVNNFSVIGEDSFPTTGFGSRRGDDIELIAVELHGNTCIAFLLDDLWQEAITLQEEGKQKAADAAFREFHKLQRKYGTPVCCKDNDCFTAWYWFYVDGSVGWEQSWGDPREWERPENCVGRGYFLK